MKSFKTFIADNWLFSIIGLLLLYVCTLMGCFFRPLVGCCLVMLLNFIILGILTMGSNYKHSIIIFSAYFLLTWLFCWLGWNYLTLLLPIAILAINAVATGTPGTNVLSACVISILCLIFAQETRQLNEAKRPEYAVEAVIAQIEKHDRGDIMVELETNEGVTILPFYHNVKDAWKLEKGDTISFNVYNDMIVAFEKK